MGLFSDGKVATAFNNFLCSFKNFIYGELYPVFLAVLTVVLYYFDLPLVGVSVFVVIASLSFIFIKDSFPIIPLLIFIPFFFRSVDAFGGITVYLIFIPVLISLVIHFIRFPIKKLYFGNLFLPLVLMSIVLILGGIGSKYYIYFNLGISVSLGLGVALLIMYFYLTQYLDPPKCFDYKKYLAFTVLMLGCAVAFEIFIAKYIFLIDLTKALPTMGWGNVNNAGYIFLMSVPCTFYLLLKNKNFVFFVISLSVQLLGVAMTKSDGTISLTALFLVIMSVYSIIKLPKARRFCLLWIITVVISGIFAFLVINIIKDSYFLSRQINKIIRVLSDDNHRTLIYKYAIISFRENPIFGVGSGYLFTEVGKVKPWELYVQNFHCSILHAFATLGTVGGIVYLYYLAKRFMLFTKVNSSFSFLMFCAFIQFELYSLIDCGEWLFLLITLTIILIVVEFDNKRYVPSLPLSDEKVYTDKHALI